jgi:GNAT superfamily N-acetyltransferase
MTLRPTSSVNVRPATPADVAVIADIHGRLLPHGFFADLGPRFLRAYHRSFMASPHAVSMVACCGEQVAGVIAGAMDATEHQRYVIRHHGPRLLAAGAVALVLRPALLMRFLTTRLGRYARGLLRAVKPAGAGGERPTSDGPPGPVAVLTHVAVDPAMQGGGAGSALVGAYVDEVRRDGRAERIELVTLAEEGASGFYERLGWTACGEHLREGAAYRRFSLKLR